MMGAILVLAAGVALAVTKSCTTTDWCNGTPENDVLTGNGKDNRIDGKAGDDKIDGVGGNDTLVGSGGKDTVYGRQGKDTLRGQEGSDLLDGGDDRDLLEDPAGGDRDQHYGRPGDDTLKANDGENTKTTTGEFDPNGPNLDYVDGGSDHDTCYVDPGDTYLNCQVVYIQQPTATTTTAASTEDTTKGSSTKLVKATKADGIVFRDDNTPRTVPEPSTEQ